jgi:hypothetical protein
MTPSVSHVYWYYKHKNQSPLVTPEFLARQRRVLMPAQYAREHENSWVDAADSFTTAAEVDAAMQTGWTEQGSGLPGCTYEHFWDLGSVKDPSVGGVGHVEDRRIYIDHLVTFQGSHEHPVLLPVVKQAMIDLAQRFPPKRIRIESWQGLSAAQELKAEGLPVELFAPTAKAHAEEWPVLAQRLSSRTLILFPHARLREELLNLTYEVGPSGVRVLDKGKIHQDHAVVVRGIVAGLTGPVLPPLFFYSEGRFFGAPVETRSAPGLAHRLSEAISTGLTTALQAIGMTGQALAAPVMHLTEAEPQAYPTHDGHRRSIQELEQLDPGCRSSQEQSRLDQHYATQRRRHIDTPFETFLKRGGVHFPGIYGDSSTEGSPDPMEQIRATFQRWR